MNLVINGRNLGTVISSSFSTDYMCDQASRIVAVRHMIKADLHTDDGLRQEGLPNKPICPLPALSGRYHYAKSANHILLSDTSKEPAYWSDAVLLSLDVTGSPYGVQKASIHFYQPLTIGDKSPAIDAIVRDVMDNQTEVYGILANENEYRAKYGLPTVSEPYVSKHRLAQATELVPMKPDPVLAAAMKVYGGPWFTGTPKPPMTRDEFLDSEKIADKPTGEPEAGNKVKWREWL